MTTTKQAIIDQVAALEVAHERGSVAMQQSSDLCWKMPFDKAQHDALEAQGHAHYRDSEAHQERIAEIVAQALRAGKRGYDFRSARPYAISQIGGRSVRWCDAPGRTGIFGGNPLAEDLEALGVPEWLARLVSYRVTEMMLYRVSVPT